MRTSRLFKKASISVILLVLCNISLAAPKIVTWKTANGVAAFYVHAPELPMVDIQVMFDAGSARDKDKSGLAVLANRLMPMGTAGKSATQLAEIFEGVGAKQSQGALRDSAWISVRSLNDKEYLNKSLLALTDIISKPTFTQKDFDRELKRMIIGLKQKEQSPKYIAKQAFFKTLYADHPYQSLPEGTHEGLKKINRDDLVAFHKRYYVGANTLVAVVGAVSEKQARVIVKRLTSTLPKGSAAPKIPEVKPLTAAKTVRIKHPSTQSHIYIGQPGVYRGDPDYFALYMSNHAFGGSTLVSRLGEEVREKRGLSYGVSSYFAPMRRRGPFLMMMQTKNAQAAEGLKVMMETLKKFVKEGMTKKEYIASKKNITGGFPLRIDSNNKIVEYISMIGFYNLPKTYLNDFNKNIESVTLAKANAAFKKRINPEKMITIIVGGK